MDTQEAALQAQFQAEMAALADKPVELHMTGLDAWVLLSQLQLALRHPGNIGASAEMARVIAGKLQEAVAVSPALFVVAVRGWDPEYDVERSPKEENDGDHNNGG
jgi:hypothetical protein